MKFFNYLMLAGLISLTSLLIGCDNRNSWNRNNRTTIVDPQGTYRSNVVIRTTNKGNVKSLSMNVHLPAGTRTSLLDYNGTSQVSGTLTADNSIRCLAGPSPFNCSAQFSAGNITLNNCSMAGSSVSMTVALKRSSYLAGRSPEGEYEVEGIILNPAPNCYLQNRTPGYPTRPY